MHLLRETLLLFSLNLLDALLTIVWVRNGVASEGNTLMARLLETGDFAFLAAKIGIGIAAAVVLLKWGDLPIAKYAVGVALAIYIGLMCVHTLTGLSALGYVPQASIEAVSHTFLSIFG
ncbi:MAG: DUF5658 family protein [Pyrinomonadaceae bacterium]